MYRTVSIPKGNSFSIAIPLLHKVNGNIVPVNTLLIENLQVLVKNQRGDEAQFSVNVENNCVILAFNADLEVSTYAIIIEGVYNTQSISVRIQGAFNIVEWSNLSRGDNYIQGQQEVLDPQILVGCYFTDSELEEIKQRYRTLVAETEQAKLELELSKQYLLHKAEQLEDVARQTVLAKVQNDVEGLITYIGHYDDPEVSKTISGKLNTILSEIQSIDLTHVALEATSQEVKTLVLEVLSLLGTSSDTETVQTVFGKLAAIVNAISSIDFSELAKEQTSQDIYYFMTHDLVELIETHTPHIDPIPENHIISLFDNGSE